MKSLIHQYLDYYAQLTPHSEAVVCLDKSFSYQELNRRANQLAGILLNNGTNTGDRIGIYLEKCVEVSVALYGILKSGAAYVPLDPNAPIQRICEIVQDCNINIIVTSDSKLKETSQIAQLANTQLLAIGPTANSSIPCECVSWAQVFDSRYTRLPEVKTVESDLAYIIYTSGSTGKPKGMMHTHYSSLSFVKWAAKEFQLTADDRLGNHAPLHFDLSIFDWFAGLISGACTIVIPEIYTKFPASCSELIADSKMTVLYTVPFALIQLSTRGAIEERDLSHLRWVIFAGESFPVKHLRILMSQLPWVKFDNVYGPAELNGCTHYTVSELPEEQLAIPIGKLNPNAQALVVDGKNQLVDLGKQGELLVSSPTMMQGYWGRPDLNEAAFFNYQPEKTDISANNQLFYRTGDLVQQSKDGNYWFLGRKDRQVKLRGYRIELDEVETRLMAHPAVEEGAVYLIKNDERPTDIFASYTLKNESDVEHATLLNFLKSVLPSYAMPAKLIKRDQFPRTSTGKIDRNVLINEVSNVAS